MPSESGDYFWVEVKTVGEVAVARITLADLWKNQDTDAVTAELIHVADDLKPPRLVVDMSAVTGLGSRMIGQLAHLHKQVRAAGGRLALCQLQPDVFEVIQICNLTTLFSVYPSEDEAVKSFAAE